MLLCKDTATPPTLVATCMPLCTAVGSGGGNRGSSDLSLSVDQVLALA